MSCTCSGVTIHIGTVNIYLGGEPVVARRPRVRLLYDSSDADRCNNNSNQWKVTPAGSGPTGTLDRVRVFYNNGAGDGYTVYARIVEGAYVGPDPEPFDLNGFTPGTSSSGSQMWTWSNSLNVASYSSYGVPHHVVFYKYHAMNGTSAFEGVENFLATVCGGSHGSPIPAVLHSLSHAPTLELNLFGGELRGMHVAPSTGCRLWEILSGPLARLVRFEASECGQLTVTTPHGSATAPIPRAAPFEMVVPGRLFGIENLVVISAP